MSGHPLVSVVMPAYNAAPYIEEAIRSALSQSWSNLEVVVVNDGSKDDTAILARAIGDDRVRVIDRANGGVSNARNTGVDAAHGEFIAFLDADDALHPRAIEFKMDALQRAGADWAYSDMWTCDSQLLSLIHI